MKDRKKGAEREEGFRFEPSCEGQLQHCRACVDNSFNNLMNSSSQANVAFRAQASTCSGSTMTGWHSFLTSCSLWRTALFKTLGKKTKLHQCSWNEQRSGTFDWITEGKISSSSARVKRPISQIKLLNPIKTLESNGRNPHKTQHSYLTLRVSFYAQT